MKAVMNAIHRLFPIGHFVISLLFLAVLRADRIIENDHAICSDLASYELAYIAVELITDGGIVIPQLKRRPELAQHKALVV